MNNLCECNNATGDVASQFEEGALVRLRERGFRITMPRVQVIRALASTNRPLSAYTIHQRILDSGGRIDVVSVYRILTTLAESNLIHHITSVDGFMPCRVAEHGSLHTQHLVCHACGCVEELELSESIADETGLGAAGRGFQMERIHLEISGTCAHCHP